MHTACTYKQYRYNYACKHFMFTIKKYLSHMIIHKNTFIFFLINDLMQYHFITYRCYTGQGQEEADDPHPHTHVTLVFTGRREFVLNTGQERLEQCELKG